VSGTSDAITDFVNDDILVGITAIADSVDKSDGILASAGDAACATGAFTIPFGLMRSGPVVLTVGDKKPATLTELRLLHQVVKDIYGTGWKNTRKDWDTIESRFKTNCLAELSKDPSAAVYLRTAKQLQELVKRLKP
jgi:hypothetical protein